MRDISVRTKLTAACVMLFLLPLLLFWQVWWPDPEQRLVFAHGDFTEQNLVMRRFVAQEWRAGQLPVWEPYTLGGQPVAASSVFQTFYPLGLWQALLEELPIFALQLEAVLHLGLAGVFTCLLLYRLTGRLDAAVVGALTFSWGGLLTSWPTLQFWILETMIWLPAGVWLLEEALQRHSLRWGMLAGVAFACSILAGHAQTVLYIAYFSGAYMLWRWWQRQESWNFMVRLVGVVVLVTLGLSAVQWLPSVEQARLSYRAGWEYADVAQGFQVQELSGLFFPNPGEWSPLYIGWIPLALAGASLVLWRRRERFFWVAVVVVSLLLSLGGNGFLYSWAYRFAPGFRFFRHQERIAYLVSFGLATLAAFGYAGLAARVNGRLELRRWLLPVVLLLVAADLYRANNGVILERQQLPYFPETRATQFLRQRLDSGARMNSEGLLPGDGNAGMVFRLRDVTGNNPMRLGAYDLTLDIVPEVRWWQLFNVDYVVTQRTFDYPGISLVLDDPEAVAIRHHQWLEGLRIYRLELGGEPVWIAHEIAIMPNQEAAIWYTSDMGLVDPSTTAVLEQHPDILPQPATGLEYARLTDAEALRVSAEVSLSAPGVVIFSEIDYPGWVLTANGERVETLRAFGLLRAVALPAGEWELEWRFRPTSVYVGLGLTLFTLAALVLVASRNLTADG